MQREMEKRESERREQERKEQEQKEFEEKELLRRELEKQIEKQKEIAAEQNSKPVLLDVDNPSSPG